MKFYVEEESRSGVNPLKQMICNRQKYLRLLSERKAIC
jgi:hypothetical protein